MSHSSHSRFSKLKRRFRDERKKRRLSEVQASNQANKTPRSSSQVLRKSRQRSHSANLQNLSHRATQTDTREGAKEYSFLLGSGIYLPSNESG